MAWAKRLIRKCFGLCLYRLTSCVLIIWLDLACLMLAWKGLGKRGGSSCGAVEKKMISKKTLNLTRIWAWSLSIRTVDFIFKYSTLKCPTAIIHPVEIEN